MVLCPQSIYPPEDVTERMVREIDNVRSVDVNGTNHYSIVFQPNAERDQAIREFLRE